MNRKNTKMKFLWIPAAVLILAAMVLCLIPKENSAVSWEGLQVRLTVQRFLNGLKRENYKKAYACVQLIDAQTGARLEKNDELRDAWIGRVKQLREGSDYTYLESYEDLQIKKENGQYVVTVKLNVMRQGYQDLFYSGGSEITLIQDGGWKIVSVSSESPELQTPFEAAVSGRIDSAGAASES